MSLTITASLQGLVNELGENDHLVLFLHFQNLLLDEPVVGSSAENP